jgi:hypothetical protein
MPRRMAASNQELPGEDSELHPVGVAGDPEATNPHEADPTPNTMKAARSAGIQTEAFEVVGDRPARRNGPVARGRQLNDSTVAALQFLRQHPGQYCKVGEWTKPGAPTPRLQWMGFHQDENGSLSSPDARGEKENLPDSYDVRKKIAYSYRENDEGKFDLLLCLTDEDYQEPKRRGPRNKPATEDINTTTTSADGATDSANPNLDGDEVPVDEETEPTEAQ